MANKKTQTQRRAQYMKAAGRMYDKLEEWYDDHPEARFGEIEAEARRQRRELMGETLRILINERDRGFQLEPVKCEKCGQAMEFERYGEWTVKGLEGDTVLERAYYACPKCEGETLFPPRSQTQTARGSLE